MKDLLRVVLLKFYSIIFDFITCLVHMAYNNNPPHTQHHNKAHFYDRSREITVFF